MRTDFSLSKNKFLSYLAFALVLLGSLHYAVLHWTLIADPMPLTARESSSVVITEDYLSGLSQGIYSPYAVAHYPQSTSVYGPAYTVLTAGLQWLLDAPVYSLHRILNGVLILFSAGLCGYLVSRKVGIGFGLGAALWFYLTQVSSSSVGAGPDALGLFFYVLGMASVCRFGCGRLGLCLAVGAGFLGLLTKPYVSLIIPVVLIYTYLFHSPRRALMAAAVTASITLIGIGCVALTMPTYYHSVIQIHSAFATSVFEHLLAQSGLFSKLNAGLLIAFIFAFPRHELKQNIPSIKALWGEEALVRPDIGFDRLLVLLAAAVLLLKLGWHGGAFLTYFNHLLLPPLLVAAFRVAENRAPGSFLLQALLLVNLALLVFFRPPLRAESAVHLSVMAHLSGKTVLVDPILEPIARLYQNVDLVDNGQTEYLIKYDTHFTNPLTPHSVEWQQALKSDLENGAYEGLYLSPVYYRELLLDEGNSSAVLYNNYERRYVAPLEIYFVRFKNRADYGKGIFEVYYFEKKDTVGSAVIPD